MTDAGSLWTDFESACIGPIEWDLSAMPTCAALISHDEELFALLRGVRRACVVTWCASKANKTAQDEEAIAHHIDLLESQPTGCSTGA